MVHGISTHVKLSVWTVFEGCSFACSFQGARHLEVVNPANKFKGVCAKLFLLLLLLLLLAPLAPPHHPPPKMASLNPRDAGLLAVSRCKASQNPHRLTHWVNRFSRCITIKQCKATTFPISDFLGFPVFWGLFCCVFFCEKKMSFLPFLPHRYAISASSNRHLYDHRGVLHFHLRELHEDPGAKDAQKKWKWSSFLLLL